MPIKNISNTYSTPFVSGGSSLLNRYQYNGKELETDFGLLWNDYGARWYDPQLARWHQIDPLAEKYAGWSGCNYVLGNPMRLVDIDGRDTSFANNDAQEQFKQVTTEVNNRVDTKISS